MNAVQVLEFIAGPRRKTTIRNRTDNLQSSVRLWEEARELGENPYSRRGNMETQHRNALQSYWTHNPIAVRCQCQPQHHCVAVIIIIIFFQREKNWQNITAVRDCRSQTTKTLNLSESPRFTCPCFQTFFCLCVCTLRCQFSLCTPILAAGYIILSTSRLSTYRINNASVKPITWRRPQINSSQSFWISHGWLNWFSTVKWSSNKQASPTWKGSDSHQNLNSL